MKKYQYSKIVGPTGSDGGYLYYEVGPKPQILSGSTVKGIIKTKKIFGLPHEGFVVEKWDGSFVEVNGAHVEAATLVEEKP